jgi:hypothetical protein
MKDIYNMKEKILKKLLLKEESYAFSGWDFSHLKGRWDNEELTWNYKQIVLSYLNDNLNMLDMGTGGGEFLLTLNHPYNKTSITEAYEPNIKICKEVLEPKGIQVFPILQDDVLINVPSDHYDIVVNRHESYDEKEVKRVLINNGIFITQQVGAFNNKDLATFFDPNHQDQFPKMTLKQTIERLVNEGFEILYTNEHYPKIKFYDLGAVVYFAKVIEWEFKNFSVEASFDKFLILNDELIKNGYIESTEHRLIIVAVKR